MGYKETAPTTYVVFWPESRVIKAGYSAFQRWRKFVIQGAQVVKLVEFPSCTEAFALESRIMEKLRSDYEYAFDTLDESRGLLGPDGGGWCECFQLPPGVSPTDAIGAVK